MTDNKPKPIPFADITVKNGTYEKDGETRNRYHKIGTLFVYSEETKELLAGHRVGIKLDSLPAQGEGWLSVFERSAKEEKSGYEKAKEVRDSLDTISEVDEEPINLDNIPF